MRALDPEDTRQSPVSYASVTTDSGTKRSLLKPKSSLNFVSFVVKAAKLELRQDVSFVLASDIVPVIWFLYYTACTHD
jgi:hypothetical protein